MTPEKVEKLLSQEYLTPMQASQILGVAYGTMINRIKSNQIEHIVEGSTLLKNPKYLIPSRVIRQIWERDKARGTERNNSLAEV